MNEQGTIIGEVSKNSLERVRVQVSRWRGKVYVDARIFVQDDPQAPDVVIATKKGLCLSPAVLLELLPLLSKAQEEAAGMEEGRGQ